MKHFKQFYKHTIEQRQAILNEQYQLSSEDYDNLEIDVANHMIENAISVYEVPLGVAPNFLVNNKHYVVPMATEEPSVIAAASNGAKIIAQSGGFSAKVEQRAMIGEIVFHNPVDPVAMAQYIENNLDTLKALALEAHPSIHARGGGLISVESKFITKEGHTPFFIVYFTIDTKEAMGANIVNTILESIQPHLELEFNSPSLMSIISNFATACLVHVRCELDPKLIRMSEEQCHLFTMASDLASVDIYRATTHNKGIMNGISAVALASGNDTRAIEAGAHAYASINGEYSPLATWSYHDGILHGDLTLPLALGTVGGSIGIHPKAQLTQKILQFKDAKELMMVTASVGLAQNFAALRALTSEGIQKGHMSLQAKSLLLSVGALEDEINQVLPLLLKEKQLNTQSAETILNTLRNSK